jgi:hypothetical protein
MRLAVRAAGRAAVERKPATGAGRRRHEHFAEFRLNAKPDVVGAGDLARRVRDAEDVIGGPGLNAGPGDNASEAGNRRTGAAVVFSGLAAKETAESDVGHPVARSIVFVAEQAFT